MATTAVSRARRFMVFDNPKDHKEEHEASDNGLRYQVREGALCSVMSGGGETYLSAFALLLHANPFQIALLAALPQIVGTGSQLLSVKVLQRRKARKPLILIGAAGQAIAWLPLFILPMLFPTQAAWLLLTAAMFYFAMGHFTAPAWNSLITDLVEADQRGTYFAWRTKVAALASFLALAGAGLVLSVSENWKNPALGFGIIFFIAAVARSLSTRYLARMKEPPLPESREPELGVREFLQHERSGMFRRFLVFSGCFHVATMISGPFFVVYLLRDLHLTYLRYCLWLSAPIVAQLVSLQEWGRIADKFGNKKVLVVTGLAIPVIPMLYLVSTDWPVLVAINFLSGILWPGFSLSLQNYVFDVVPAPDRAKGVAIYNGVNAAGAAAGAMLGSWLAAVAQPEILLFGFTLPLVSNLPVVFFTSGALRLVVSLTLLKSFKEGRTVTPISHRQLVHELPLIRPLTTVLGLRASRMR